MAKRRNWRWYLGYEELRKWLISVPCLLLWDRWWLGYLLQSAMTTKSVSGVRGGLHSGGAEGHWQSYHNTIVINTSNNCCTSAGGLRKRNTPGVKSRVAVEVGEVEARHRGNAGECDGESGYQWWRERESGSKVGFKEKKMKIGRVKVKGELMGEGGRERERELFGVTKLPQPGG
jgi:hypothetical protein